MAPSLPTPLRQFGTAADGLAWLLFPTRCAGCGAGPQRSPLCDDCLQAILASGRPACPRCGLKLGPCAAADHRGCSQCRGRSLGFSQVVTLGAYEGPLPPLCLALKREPGAWLASWLVDYLLQAEQARIESLHADLITPVPLHWTRRWHRGFNQSSLLASRLARRLRLPTRTVLRRREAGAFLAGASRTQRLDRMKHAFVVPRSRRRHVQGRTILLVDDIVTTGATSGAAARALRFAGAAQVVVLAIARAEGVAR